MSVMQRTNTLFIVLIICLIGLTIGYFVLGVEKKESYQVKITGQFVDSVSNYNRIYPYSEGVAVVRKGKYYGFVDAMGKQLTPCIYDQVRPFMNGIAAVSRADKDGRWAFVDVNGKEIVPFKYDKTYFIDKKREDATPLSAYTSDALMPVCIQGKWGFMNTQGVEVIACQYSDALLFTDHLAAVCKRGKYGYIDVKGNVVIPFQYQEARHFTNGLAPVKKGGKWGFIDTNGAEVIPFVYVYDAEMEAYTKFGLPRIFSEGLQPIANEDDTLVGCINVKGEVVVPFGKYQLIQPFSEGLAAVANDEVKWGFINTKGEEVIPCRFNAAMPFAQGLAPVKLDDFCGFVNKEGKVVIPCIYDNVKNFTHGLAAVNNGGKWGYVDAQGKEVIPTQYNVAFPFNEGEVAQVSYKRVYGLIDKNGNGTFKEE